MKTTINISIILILAITLGACSSSYKAGVSEYDDLYYTPRDARMQSEASNARALADEPGIQAAAEDELSDYEKYMLSLEGEYKSEEAAPEITEYAQEDTLYYDQEGDYGYAYYEDGSQPPVINHYYGTVNQYPSYSSRIQRFHSPYTGYGYYDPWYGGYGSNFSVSIGFGMGWGYPSYGWGYPSYGWGYPGYGCGYPGYGYGSYYSSYNRGYNHGWYDGYYQGGGYYYPTPYSYYSDYGRTGTTYGHRASRSGYSTYGARTMDPKKTNTTAGSYGRTRGTGTTSTAATATRSNAGSGSMNAARRSSAITAAGTTSGTSRSRMQEKTPTTSRASYTGNTQRNNNSSGNARPVTTVRGTDQKPGNGQARKSSTYTTRSNNTSRYTTTTRKSYTPTYTKPRTTYKPSYNTSSSRSSNAYKKSTTRSTYTQPRSTSTSRSISTPSRSGSSYRSTPSSSYRSSSPSRSSGSSYRSSSPSRSSGSVSRSSGSVSRSSGSSSRSSSASRSSSSSGGRRR